MVRYGTSSRISTRPSSISCAKCCLLIEPRIEAHGIRRAKAAIAVESLKKLPGAIDVLVKALRAGEPEPIREIEQITEGRYVQESAGSSEDFDFLGIGALRASRPLSVIR